MIRTALRNVLAHKARLLMTVLAVMLGVAFVSGTLVFTNSITGAYTESSEKSFDHVDVRIRPVVGQGEPGSGRLLDQELLDRARALPGVRTATGIVSGFAALAGRDGTLVGEGWSTQGTNYPGADGPRYPIAEGRAPQRDGGGGGGESFFSLFGLDSRLSRACADIASASWSGWSTGSTVTARIHCRGLDLDLSRGVWWR